MDSPESKHIAGQGWLVLVHQLPSEPAYLRVKVARRLRRLGAVALKGAVHVLPRRDGTSEDFRWLRREIVAAGGAATLLDAAFVEGLDDQEVRAMFDRERDAEYDDIGSAAAAAARDGSTAEELRRLRRRLGEVGGRDFFGAAGRDAAEQALAALANRLAPGDPSATPAEQPVERPRGATWVTRRNPKVDRLSTAWLIRRFVDPEATLVFVEPSTHVQTSGEIRFDMYESEVGHEGDRCTFETALRRFGLEADPGLLRLGEIVHDLDLRESRFGHPESAGVEAAIRGFVEAYADDHTRVDAAGPFFDALYAAFGGRR
jgi:hypothetical protein